MSYHQRFSSDWIRRLGDGTEESHEKIQDAIDALWTYTDELFYETEVEQQMINEGIAVNISELKQQYYDEVTEVLEEATLRVPESKWFLKGGKEGVHTEHLGYLLSDLQYMQRTYPDMTW